LSKDKTPFGGILPILDHAPTVSSKIYLFHTSKYDRCYGKLL